MLKWVHVEILACPVYMQDDYTYLENVVDQPIHISHIYMHNTIHSAAVLHNLPPNCLCESENEFVQKLMLKSLRVFENILLNKKLKVALQV